MTFKEKWNMEHPDRPYKPGNLGPGCVLAYFTNAGMGAVCTITTDCAKCWDREIPEEESCELKRYNPIQKAYDLMVGFCHENKTTDLEEVIGYLGEALGTEEGANAIRVSGGAPGIKDSGDRTEFATGAVRDMREGKGRCDLMPLRVAGMVMQGDAVLDYIGLFKDTGDTEFLYSAIKHFAHAFGGLANMLLEVAKHFEEGAKKYGENNWQKGIPVHCYIDSAVRHYLKWLRGDKDEPHDRAFVWNLMCCIWEVDYREKEKDEGNA